jgi:hypothetical protein
MEEEEGIGGITEEGTTTAIGTMVTGVAIGR